MSSGYIISLPVMHVCFTKGWTFFTTTTTINGIRRKMSFTSCLCLMASYYNKSKKILRKRNGHFETSFCVISYNNQVGG